MDVQGHQRALPGTAAGNNKINGFSVKQNARHDAQVNIGEMMIVLITHTDVIDRKTFLISNGFQLIKDDGILSGLAVFHHQCNFHLVSPECMAGDPAVDTFST